MWCARLPPIMYKLYYKPTSLVELLHLGAHLSDLFNLVLLLTRLHLYVLRMGEPLQILVVMTLAPGIKSKELMG